MKDLTKCPFCDVDLVDNLQDHKNRISLENHYLSSALLSEPLSYYAWCPNVDCSSWFFCRALSRLIADDKYKYMYIVAQFGKFVVALYEPGLIKKNNTFVYIADLGSSDSSPPKLLSNEKNAVFNFTYSEEDFLKLSEKRIEEFLLS